MGVSLDYINEVIARNNAGKQAGAGAPASSGSTGSKIRQPQVNEAELQRRARLRMQRALASGKKQNVQNARDIYLKENEEARKLWTLEHGTNMSDRELEQAQWESGAMRRQMDSDALRTYEEIARGVEQTTQTGQDQRRNAYQMYMERQNLGRAAQYDYVQNYLAQNEKASELWAAEHAVLKDENKIALLRSTMTEQEQAEYDAIRAERDAYGAGYELKRRVGGLVAGSLQNAAGNVLTAGQTVVNDYKDRMEALQQTYQQERSVNPLKAFEQVNSTYRQELDKVSGVVQEDNTPGLQLAREGSEQMQRGAAGLGGAGKVAYDLAGSMVANAPSMALALVPGVGPAASLGTMGAQAAGGKIDELSQKGVSRQEALERGVVSGIIEAATEKLPVSSWTKIVKTGGKKALQNILQQALGEGTEEAASYVANWFADKVYQDPDAEFSLQDLAYSAAMGAASGGIYGAVGTGINRIGNKVASSTRQTGEKGAQVNQANKPAYVLAVAQADNPLNQLIPGGRAAQSAAQAQQNTANAARAQQAVEGAVQADNPLNQLIPGGQAAQNAAQAQQNTVDTARAQQAVEGAVQADNPLNQLTPGGRTAQSAAQAQQNAMNVARAQQEEAQQSAMRVRKWAEENESFTPEMRTLAEENYQPGGNTALYTTAMQNFYDAGRSGALSYEQAMELNQNRAAVLQQDSVLRRAWELGQKAVNPVYDTPGGGRVEGQVQYENGVEPNAVLDDTVLQAAAHKLGVNIKVVQELTDDAGGKANGRWAAAMSEIALGENSSNAYQTLAHEMTHYMGSYNPEGWHRLRSSALEWYARQGGQRTREDMARYEAAYGDYAKGADEAARDILSGVMSTEGGVRSFLAYLSTESGYTVQEQKTILQTLREMLDALLEKVRGLLRGGDATVTAAQARQMAERADQLEARRALINDYLYELDNARQNAEQAGLQLSAKENAPAASRSEADYSINPEFDREIREWDAEGRNESKIFTLGTTSEALKSIGVRDRSIVMLSGKIRKILRDHPSMTMDMIRQIPAMLEHPALVLESQGGSILPGTKKNSRIVVVGTVTDAQGNPVLCALDLAPSSKQDMELGLQDFNKVSSAYAKDVNPKGFLEKSNVLYASPDKKMTQAALSSFSYKYASSELNHLGSIGRITYQGGKVNIQGVPFRQIFGEAGSDAAYSRQVDSRESEKKQFPQGKHAGAEQVSYSNLKELPDMPVIDVESGAAQGKSVQQLIEDGLNSTQRTPGKKNGRVVNNYTGDTIVVTQEGLRHGLLRKGSVQKNGVYIGKIGEIIKNAVKINELEPRGKELRSDVYLGACRDENGEMRAIRFIVNMYENGKAELDDSGLHPLQGSLYAHTSKKVGTAPIKGQGISTNAVAPDRSNDTISIAEFLQSVKDSWGEDLPRNVRYELGLPQDSEKKGKSLEGALRYSRKGGQALELAAEQRRRRAAETENRKLARENSRMADQIELLKQETRLSGGHMMDIKAVHDVAARVVKNANSRYSAAQLESELRRVYESMSRGKVSGVQEAMETLTDLARGVLSQQRTGENQAREVYQPLLEKVRAEDWTVREGSPLYQDLLDMYGDGPNGKTWGNVRKALFGRIDIKKTSESGASGRIDALFEELAGDWPGIFDPEAAPADNIQRLMEVYDEVRDGAAYDLETGMSEEEQAAYLAQDLYDAYLSMPRRQTFADKSAAQAEALTRQYRQEKTKALEQQKAGYEQKLQEQRKWARDRMKELEQRYKEARQTHDQELIIKTHNQIAEARRQANDSLLRRRAALEMQWSNKRERADVTQQRQRVQKSVQVLHRWLTKPTEQQHVQTRMQQKVLNLLNSLDMKVGREGTATAMRWQEAMKDIQLMANDALAADSGMKETDAYADFDPDLPAMIEELINSTDTLNVAKMNSYQLRQLADILTSMQTSIRNANKMMSDAKKAEVEMIGQRSAQEMDSERKKLLKTRKEWAKKVSDTKMGDLLGGMLGLDMMDARRYFRTLGKTAEENIYEPLRRGFDKRVWLLDSAQKAFENIKGDADIRKWTGDKADTQTFTLQTAKGKKVDVPLTVGQRMELYNLSQRPQAKEHLMQGGITLVNEKGQKAGERINLTPESLAEITGSLTNEQVQMARKLSDYLSAKDGPAGWGNEVSRELYGLDKFTEQHYWPIKSDNNQVRSNDATESGTAGLWAVKNQGFTKGLQKHAKNSILVGDVFDTWADHVVNMATYNAWCIPLSDAMKWYNWKSGTDVSTKEQIELLYGSKGKKFFTTLMQDVNGMTARASSTNTEGLVGTATKNWKIAKVSGNWRVVIQQPTSYLRAMAVMNPKYLMQAMSTDLTKLNHGMKMAEEHCAIAKWKSWGYFETSIGQSMREVLTGKQGIMDRVRDLGTKPAEIGDKVTWGTLWNACEAEAKDKGLEAGTDKFNQYCSDRLGEIVDKTQVVDSVLHRSQLMRNQNGAIKMMTAFFAEPTKSYNMVAEACADMAHGEKGAKGRLLRVAATFVVSALGTSAAASLIDAMRVTRDDDRDKEYGERYLENLWQNFIGNVNLLNNIPIVKDIWTVVMDGYDVTRQDMEMVSDLKDAFDAISKGLEGDITPYRLSYQVATAVSSLTGLPMSNVLRDTKSAYDMLTDLQDPLRLDRTMNRAPDDYSYIDLYNQVRAAEGDAKAFKALYNGETYSEMLGTPEAAAVDAWVEKLAQNSAKADADGNQKENTAVLPKRLGNEITYTDSEGVEHKVVLQGPDYLDYAKSVQQGTVNLLNEYMHGQGKTASTAEQAAYVKMAREYAQELAREMVIPGYEIESWVQTVETLSGGKNVGEMIAARQIVSQTEGDKDEDGETITGSAEMKAVGRLQSDLGYSEPEARTLYSQLKGKEDDTYLQLYEDVKGNREQEEQLSALYVMAGEQVSYAEMLQNSSAKRLDEQLQKLSETQGNDVLPDRVGNTFKVGDTEVELDGKEYVAYAKKRTETAYNILNELIPYMGNYTQKEQAGFVMYVEKYATELAKASVSDFELSNWVEEVQQLAGGDNAALYNYIMAKELIALAQGKKDANGKTISGTKKAAALRNLKSAGYSDYMAQQMYKLFG